jgi:hypothetical protein
VIIKHKDYTDTQRQNLADKGEAMPHGGYPIKNRADLKRAIQAIGRAKDPEATKRWIKKRAKELDCEDLIPDSWMNHSALDVEDFLAHYGVKGMRWGVRRSARERLDRANVDSAMVGWNLKGHAAKKISNRRKKKEPDWDRHKYEKLPEAERKKYDRKINRSAYARSVGTGAAATGVVLGGRQLLMSNLKLSRSTSVGLNQASIFLAAGMGLTTLLQLKGIHDANKIDRLRKEVHGR